MSITLTNISPNCVNKEGTFVTFVLSFTNSDPSIISSITFCQNMTVIPITAINTTFPTVATLSAQIIFTVANITPNYYTIKLNYNLEEEETQTLTINRYITLCNALTLHISACDSETACGQRVKYTYKVCNTGSYPIKLTNLVDSIYGNLANISTFIPDSDIAGNTCRCYVFFACLPSNCLNTSIKSVGTVTGIDVNNEQVQATDKISVLVYY